MAAPGPATLAQSGRISTLFQDGSLQTPSAVTLMKPPVLSRCSEPVLCSRDSLWGLVQIPGTMEPQAHPASPQAVCP